MLQRCVILLLCLLAALRRCALSGERIVILSTHIVSDVESTATDIAIIHKGHLIVRARPEQLLKQMEGSVWEWMTASQELPALKQQFLVSGELLHATSPGLTTTPPVPAAK